MTKLLDFPAKRVNISFEDAILKALDDCSEETRNTKVRNMMVITDSEDIGFIYHILNDQCLSSLIGKVDIVKTLIMMQMISSCDYSAGDSDEDDED